MLAIIINQLAPRALVAHLRKQCQASLWAICSSGISRTVNGTRPLLRKNAPISRHRIGWPVAFPRLSGVTLIRKIRPQCYL